MERENEHFQWDPEALRKDLPTELCRRMSLIEHWRERGIESQWLACLGRLAYQLKMVGELPDLAVAISRRLSELYPCEEHVRLDSFVRGAGMPLNRSSEHWKSGFDVVVFAQSLEALARDPDWERISDDEKRERFRGVGLPSGMPSPKDEE